MNKIPRFMKEYASYRIKDIEKYSLMSDEVRQDTVRKIRKALKLYETGKVSTNEAMSMICHCFMEF